MAYTINSMHGAQPFCPYTRQVSCNTAHVYRTAGLSTSTMQEKMTQTTITCAIIINNSMPSRERAGSWIKNKISAAGGAADIVKIYNLTTAESNAVIQELHEGSPARGFGPRRPDNNCLPFRAFLNRNRVVHGSALKCRLYAADQSGGISYIISNGT